MARGLFPAPAGMERQDKFRRVRGNERGGNVEAAAMSKRRATLPYSPLARTD